MSRCLDFLETLRPKWKELCIMSTLRIRIFLFRCLKISLQIICETNFEVLVFYRFSVFTDTFLFLTGFLFIHFFLSSDSNEFIFHICLLNSISHLYFPFPISFVISWEKKLRDTDVGFVKVSMCMLCVCVFQPFLCWSQFWGMWNEMGERWVEIQDQLKRVRLEKERHMYEL